METNTKTKRRLGRRLLVTAVTLAVVAGAWFLLAPPQVGGSVSYIVTAGTSMQPRFQTGDLALVRPAPNYQVGAIVAYRSERLHAIVLHRIVARDGDRYVFKGDNNSWLDPEHPTRAQLLGKLWLRIPSAGKLIGSRTPDEVALLTGGGLLLLLGGANVATHSRRRRRRREQTTQAPAPTSFAPGQGAQIALAVSALSLLGFSGLAGLAFTRPTSRLVSTTAAYQQAGRFSYSAVAPDAIVYPSRQVRTGDSVYLRVIDQLQVRFAYRLSSSAPRALRGTAQLTAELADASGWKRTLVLQGRTAFVGDQVTLRGTLRLAGLTALLQRFETETGATGSNHTLTLQPQVHLAGTLAGQQLEQSFTPRLPFTLDALHLAPELPNPGSEATSTGVTVANPLVPVAPGTVKFLRPAPARLSLSKLRLAVTTVRRAAPYGAAASLLVLLLAALLLLRGRRADEPTRIRARYGQLLIPVVHFERRPYDEVVEVTSIEALAQLATRYDRMILHEQGELGHSYRIADEGVLYVYLVGNPETGALRTIAAPPPAEAPAADEAAPAPQVPAIRYYRRSPLKTEIWFPKSRAAAPAPLSSKKQRPRPGLFDLAHGRLRSLL